MIQQCQYCGDFYRTDDAEIAIEMDDGWGINICYQCQTEFNLEELALEDAWNLYYQPFDEETEHERHKTA